MTVKAAVGLALFFYPKTDGSIKEERKNLWISNNSKRRW